MEPFALLRTGVFIAVWLVSPLARADDAATCASAAESSQTLRGTAHLTLARQQLLACARDTCPRIVRHDCLRWLTEVDAALPSVVFRAHGVDGTDRTDVQVLVDGRRVTDRLDGIPLSMDPGAHVVRYVGSDGAVLDTRVLVAEGEQHRVLLVTLPSSSGAPSSRQSAQLAASSTSDGRGPVPALSWALGAVAVGGAAAFAVLSLTGTSDYDHLEDTCGRTRSCTDSQVRGARAQYIAADVAVGVGVAALGGAAWSFFTRSPAAAPAAGTTGLSLAPLGSGALAAWRGAF